MDSKMIEKLKQDLKIAIENKDIPKIEEISRILNVSNDQSKLFDSGLTGFASVDKPWLKYYPEGYEEKALDVPTDKTIWDVYESKFETFGNIPVTEYFKKKTMNEEFINNCYMWARAFRGLGVEPGEVVPVYSPFVPEVCSMLFGLNMIGACPYFLKIGIKPEHLMEECCDAKVAVVFDSFWSHVSHEFSKDKYKNVVVINAYDDMPSPIKQIVSFKGKIEAMKSKSRVPKDKKYIWADKIREMSKYYSGNVKVPFESNRNAIITSSSGTTVGGKVKGTVATNESVLGQIYSGFYTETPFFAGDRLLNHFPPAAATSLNSLCLLGAYNKETIVFDPRVSPEAFFEQLTSSVKPNIALTTGSSWELFFNMLEEKNKQGKYYDLSYAKGWTIGGEGTDAKKYLHWCELMRNNGAKEPFLYYGYGLSEQFSAVSVSKYNIEDDFSKPMVGVGIPQVGMTMGIFDKDGNELHYGERGELRIKSKAAMKEYYHKPELTAKTFSDGWMLTGDLASFDENGCLFVWGRMSDSITVDEKPLYLFDVANKIKESAGIEDALVLNVPTENNENNLVAHIVWNKSVSENEKTEYIRNLDEVMSNYLPEGVCLNTYSAHEKSIPYSPTTLKKDRNGLLKQTKGFIQIDNGIIENVEYTLSPDGKHYSKRIVTPEQDKTLILESKSRRIK